MTERTTDYVRDIITPIGILRVSANKKGIRTIHQHEFRSENLIQDEVEDRNVALILNEAEEQFLAYFAGEAKHFDLPLDFSGLPEFRQKVLNAAALIPWGGFLTYGELAMAIDKPKASRAVGGALAQNPFLIVVPCHRVLSSDKALHGFSAEGGLKIKQFLLELEGQTVIDNKVIEV